MFLLPHVILGILPQVICFYCCKWWVTLIDHWAPSGTDSAPVTKVELMAEWFCPQMLAMVAFWILIQRLMCLQVLNFRCLKVCSQSWRGNCRPGATHAVSKKDGFDARVGFYISHGSEVFTHYSCSWKQTNKWAANLWLISAASMCVL